MSIEQFNEWARYALITHLAKEIGDSQTFGKKAAQKVVYLLQELGRVPVGFRYTFYTYGVFSSELANTLGVVEGLEGIKVDYDENQNTYQIKPGVKAGKLEKRGEDFLLRYKADIAKIVSFAKPRTAKRLELISTIVFIEKNEDLDIDCDEKKLIQRVRELKPQFDDQEIIVGINALRDLLSQQDFK